MSRGPVIDPPPRAGTSAPVAEPAPPMPAPGARTAALRQARERRRRRALERRLEGMRGFRPDIEGLRAIAVLLVVLFHAGVPAVGGGYVGVDVFFVISGFLITRLLVVELLTSGRISLPRFYLRRARRLLPALALVIVATMLLARVRSPLMASETAIDGIWSSAYLVNVRFMTGGLDYFVAELPDSPLLHLWSLAIEEQFYIVWPALLLATAAAARRGSVRTIALVAAGVAAASLAGSVLLTPQAPTIAYFLPLTRVWELLAGALLAIAPVRASSIPRGVAAALTALGLGAIVVAGTTFSAATVFPGSAALLPVLGTVLVIVAAPSTALGQRLLGAAPLQWTGRLSYSLYLWHWPLLALLAGAGTAAQSPSASAVAVVASVGLAWLTFRLVEDPLRRARSLVDSPRRGLAVAGALTAGPVLLAAWIVAVPPDLAGSGGRITPVELGTPAQAQARLSEAVEASVAIDELPSNLVPALDETSGWEDKERRRTCREETIAGDLQTDNCVEGVPASGDVVVVFGDSHALHWIDAFDELAAERQWRVVFLVKGLCPSMDLVPGQGGKDYEDECIDWRAKAIERIALEQPRLVVMSNHHVYCAEQDCLAGTSTTIGQVAQAAPEARLVVLEDIPFRSRDLPGCMAEHLEDIQACAEDRDEMDAQERDAIRETVLEAGARWVPTSDWLCTATSCPPTVGNVLVMKDQSHLSPEMSRLLAPVLARELDGAT